MEEGEGGRARQRGGARVAGVVPGKRVPSSQREDLGKNVGATRFPAPCWQCPPHCHSQLLGRGAHFGGDKETGTKIN